MTNYDGLKTLSRLVYETNNGENSAEFKVSHFYINNTDEDIAVIHRNNLPIILERSAGHFAQMGNFIIRTVYKFTSHQRIVNTINNIQKYRSAFNLKQEDLDLLLEALIKAYDNDHKLNFATVSIDREIANKTIKDRSCVYVNDADILLCDYRSFGKYPHPYSPEGISRQDYKNISEERKISGVFVELIDNENVIKNRYMYVAKKLVPIPSHSDPSKMSGVYFSRTEYDSLGNVHIEPEYLTFEEAEEKLGLYKTQDEALTGGNPELISKTEFQKTNAELERLRNENARMTIENAKIKEEHDIKKVVRNDQAEEISLSRKTYYEDRIYDRKDNSEFLKLSGVIIATGIGIYAALQKTSSKK